MEKELPLLVDHRRSAVWHQVVVCQEEVLDQKKEGDVHAYAMRHQAACFEVLLEEVHCWQQHEKGDRGGLRRQVVCRAQVCSDAQENREQQQQQQQHNLFVLQLVTQAE